MGRLCRLEEQTCSHRPPWRHACCFLCIGFVFNFSKPHLSLISSLYWVFLTTKNKYWVSEYIYICKLIKYSLFFGEFYIHVVVEIMENLAYLANATNLVLYFATHMHLSPSKSANHVTNFMGTSFLLALLGGFLSDAFFTSYQIYLISAVIEFLVLLITLSILHFFFSLCLH